MAGIADIDKNDLASAQKRINQAQELAPEHGAVAFLQRYLQNILSNPVEQEWRNRVYQNKQQMQEAERQRLVEQYLSQAREYQRNGQYDQAITMAERVLSLSPNNSAGQQIIRDSRESSRALNMLLIEARRNMEQELSRGGTITGATREIYIRSTGITAADQSIVLKCLKCAGGKSSDAILSQTE